MTTLNGYNNNLLLTKTTPQFEGRLVGDKQTNEFHIPLTSTVVLKHKKEKLYVALDFENSMTIDA